MQKCPEAHFEGMNSLFAHNMTFGVHVSRVRDERAFDAIFALAPIPIVELDRP